MSDTTYIFEDKSIEETAFKLLDICNKCPLDQISSKHLKDTYTSPAWAEFLKRPLTVNDIPMQSCSAEDMKAIYDEIGKVPWEDSIKNFIFDSTSVNTSKKFATCILLSEVDYEYQDATIHIIAGKYGLPNVTLVSVMPHESEESKHATEFKLKVRHKHIRYEMIIPSKALVSDIVQWYVPDSTLIFCHDNSVLEYQTSISMMPKSTWSISCTFTNFIANKDKAKECSYVCPIFSFPGSLETRAVGTGSVKFTGSNPPADYRGKLDYYSRSVRFSRHSSGKCYDCYKLLTTIRNMYKSPLSSPITPRFANFSQPFVKSLSTTDEES